MVATQPTPLPLPTRTPDLMAHALLASGQLYEYTPNNTQRYSGTDPVAAMTTKIPSILKPEEFQASIKLKVPHEWKYFYNPAEGRIYYWNENLRIFTESNINLERVFSRLMQWYHAIATLMNQLARTDYDIVLRVSESEEEGMGACGYYLVDYVSQVVSWLTEVETSALGLPDTRSPNHLRLLLSEQFWVHCEYMPPPHKDFRRAAKRLLAILGTLGIDAASSAGSVSPFHPDECRSYSKDLKQVVSTGEPIHLNWSIARLQSLLIQSQIINLFGEHNSRTDRNVVVNGQQAPPETAPFAFWSFIMFGIPSIYLSRWNLIWVDRVTYTREWKKLTKTMMEEFLVSLIMFGLILIASITQLGLTSSNVIRTLDSFVILMTICGGSYAGFLFFTFRTQGEGAADAADFIQNNEDTATGLQGMALKHSIPWALIAWSGVCISISGFWELSMDAITVWYPIIGVSAKTIMVPVLSLGSYLYGRGYFPAIPNRVYDFFKR